MNVDWTPVMVALVGLIGVIFTTLLPLGVKLFFEAQAANIEKAKALKEKYQGIVDEIVIVVQQTLGTMTNSEKYVAALQRVDAQLHLPADTMRSMIELSVATLKLAWGDEWDKLGGKELAPTEAPTV